MRHSSNPETKSVLPSLFVIDHQQRTSLQVHRSRMTYIRVILKGNSSNDQFTKCCVLDIGKRAGSPDILRMLGDKTVEQTEEVLDLGVTINNRLNFSKHIAKIVTQAHR